MEMMPVKPERKAQLEELCLSCTIKRLRKRWMDLLASHPEWERERPRRHGAGLA
jgi:hypothetical protein